MTNPDDPAFPSAPNDTGGLTKREYIALLALEGLLANPYVAPHQSRDDLAVQAMSYADALIVRLNKPV